MEKTKNQKSKDSVNEIDVNVAKVKKIKKKN